MTTKKLLKDIKELIVKKDYKKAKDGCNRVLFIESGNYQCLTFLALCQQNLDEIEESEITYRKAIENSPEQPVAYQGLINLLEKSMNYEKLIPLYRQARDVFLKNNLLAKVQDLSQKIINYYTGKSGKEEILLIYLGEQLPGSVYYSSEHSPNPLDTYKVMEKIILESKQKEVIKEVENRRRRLSNDSMAVIKRKVATEVYSDLKYLKIVYQIIQIYSKQGNRKDYLDYSEKYLVHIDYLINNTYIEGKDGFIQDIIQHSLKILESDLSSSFAYVLLLNYSNVSHPELYDKGMMTMLLNNNPTYEYANIINMSLDGGVSHNKPNLKSVEDLVFESNDNIPIFITHLMCYYYLNTKQYSQAFSASQSLISTINDCMLKDELNNVYNSCKLCIALSYLGHNNLILLEKARGLIQDVISSDPNNPYGIEAMLELNLRLNKFDEIVEIINNSSPEIKEKQNSLKGWALIKLGSVNEGIEILEQCLTKDDKNDLIHFRLGASYWIRGDPSPTTNSSGHAYFHLMTSLKYNPELGEAYLYLGQIYALKSSLKDAIKCYTLCINKNPYLLEAYKGLYNLKYQNDSELDGLEELLKMAIDAIPRDHWAWGKMAYLLLSKGSYQHAIYHFETALKLSNENSKYWEGLGTANLKAGRYKASLKSFQRAISIDPNALFSFYSMAIVYSKLENYHNAIDILDSLQSRLDDKLEDPLFILINSSKAEIAYRVMEKAYSYGDFGNVVRASDLVLESSNKVIEAGSSLASMLETCGDTLFMLNKVAENLDYLKKQLICQLLRNLQKIALKHDNSNLNEEIEKIQKEISISDLSIDINKVLIISAFCYRSSLANLSSLSSSAASPVLYKTGLVYYALYQRALSDQDKSSFLTKAIKLSRASLVNEKNNAYAWNLMGLCTIKHNPKISQHAFATSARLQPKNPSPYTNYGFLCLLQGDYELANQSFIRATDIEPEFTPALIGKAVLDGLLGNQTIAKIQHIFETNLYESRAILYYYSNKVFQRYAFNLQRTDELNTALFALQKASELYPANQQIHLLLGLIYEVLGQLDNSASCLRVALNETKGEISENSIQIYLHLGRVLCSNSNYEASLSAYKAILPKVSLLSKHDTTSLYLGMGTSAYFLDELDDALESFQIALDMNSEDSILKRSALVLVSRALWKLGSSQHREAATDMLLECVRDGTQTVDILITLYVMGLLNENSDLQQAVIGELDNINPKLQVAEDPEYDNALVQSLHRLASSTPHPEAPLQATIFKQPSNTSLRHKLVRFIISKEVTSLTNPATSQLIQSTLHHAYANKANAETVSELYGFKSVLAKRNNDDQASIFAQKALFIRPWEYTL